MLWFMMIWPVPVGDPSHEGVIDCDKTDGALELITSNPEKSAEQLLASVTVIVYSVPGHKPVTEIRFEVAVPIGPDGDTTTE